ncbi:hypothetical protein HMPREF3202_00460 [Prevotella bivia]|uniref:Uncharacterized protein n=1 Tax=Prevotella bivia TaxID=28125 RepID=A0A137T0D4_9BACT|nr:hypothetical protein HMPREF3202_00460 [Prevotella bivia]
MPFMLVKLSNHYKNSAQRYKKTSIYFVFSIFYFTFANTKLTRRQI